MPKFIVPIEVYVPVHHRYTTEVQVEAPTAEAGTVLLLQKLNGDQIDWKQFEWDTEEYPHPREIDQRGERGFDLDPISDGTNEIDEFHADQPVIAFTEADVIAAVMTEADLDGVEDQHTEETNVESIDLLLSDFSTAQLREYLDWRMSLFEGSASYDWYKANKPPSWDDGIQKYLRWLADIGEDGTPEELEDDDFYTPPTPELKAVHEWADGMYCYYLHDYLEWRDRGVQESNSRPA